MIINPSHHSLSVSVASRMNKLLLNVAKNYIKESALLTSVRTICVTSLRLQLLLYYYINTAKWRFGFIGHLLLGWKLLTAAFMTSSHIFVEDEIDFLQHCSWCWNKKLYLMIKGVSSTNQTYGKLLVSLPSSVHLNLDTLKAHFKCIGSSSATIRLGIRLVVRFVFKWLTNRKIKIRG